MSFLFSFTNFTLTSIVLVGFLQLQNKFNISSCLCKHRKLAKKFCCLCKVTWIYRKNRKKSHSGSRPFMKYLVSWAFFCNFSLPIYFIVTDRKSICILKIKPNKNQLNKVFCLYFLFFEGFLVGWLRCFFVLFWFFWGGGWGERFCLW